MKPKHQQPHPIGCARTFGSRAKEHLISKKQQRQQQPRTESAAQLTTAFLWNLAPLAAFSGTDVIRLLTYASTKVFASTTTLLLAPVAIAPAPMGGLATFVIARLAKRIPATLLVQDHHALPCQSVGTSSTNLSRHRKVQIESALR